MTGTGRPADRLHCGRSVDELIEQVARGAADQRDDHQRGCVHCQAALAEFERLWAPMAELAAETVTAPPGRLDALLRRLRGALDTPDFASLPGPDGVLRIAARVIVAVARRSAQEVPGVRVALSRRKDGGEPSVAAGVAGAHAAIEITLAADYGSDLVALAEQVRDHVARVVEDITGLTTVEITVVVDDVLS
ncbi:Asp23/Gls24 family envelope stress response protein [Pseudonocardia sp.]|uniref:Asp23/Gls24 family envelope stress response protein n=1 Tax=Pseudonocardia sp. TaxID=60912 RepID=UPI003D11B685